MRVIGLLMVVGSLALLVACGGGGGGNGGSTITSVTVACIPSTVQSGGTSQCSATVMGTGSFSSAVTWSTSAGSITSSGLLTAPTVSSTTSVTVTATSSQDSSKAGMATVTVMPIVSLNNVQPISVNSGPPGVGAVNEAFTSVTVCIPGTTQCQTIDNVLVDTGSSGLRLLSSVGGGELTLSLPQENDSSGNPLGECLAFLDGYVWGTVATADIAIAGEKAPATPVQIIIPSTSTPGVPSSCSSQNPPGGNGNEGDSVAALGGNGILGVGLFQQDCGLACTPGFQVQPRYYDCPAAGCSETSVALPQQVTNPIILFASDNNGVLLQLAAVPDGGSNTVNGSMIFGIGTQSNNGLGGATVYSVPDRGNDAGNIITTFGGTKYPGSFLDSGSNGIFFLNTATTGIPKCSGQDSAWYCPTTSPDNLSATNQGQDVNGNPVGTAGDVNFTIEDATTLFHSNNDAYSTLGAPNPGSFDWGLAFFYGRNVFTAIDNMSTPAGAGPYFAY